MVSEGQDRTGQVWKLQVGSGQVEIGQVRIGQVRTSQVRKFYARTVQIGTTEVGTVEYFESSLNLENLELECGTAQPDLLYVFLVTIFFSLGTPLIRGARLRSFLAPPMMMPAFGYFVIRKCEVLIRWSKSFEFFLDFGGE